MGSFLQTIDKFFERIKKMSFIKALFIAWGLYIVWTLFMGGILMLCGAKFSQNVTPTEMFKNSFLLLPFAAFAEEVLFRWMPMLVLNFVLMRLYHQDHLTKDRFFAMERYCLLFIVIVSCVVFGWVHGNVYNILLQGVTGLFIFVIYLRCFFIERDKGINDRMQIVPLAEATLFHSMANMLSLFV